MVEVVVDTSVSGPYLNLWAWKIHQGRRFKNAMRKVSVNNDWGFFEDVVDEVGSSTFHIPLLEIYTSWPDNIEQGDKIIIQTLKSASSVLSLNTQFFFHHVDAWPPVDIRNEKKMDIS